MSRELTDIYNQCRFSTHNGEETIDLCKRGIALADKENDENLAIYFRLEYIQQQTFYGDMTYAFIMFPEMLKLYDKYVEKNPYTSYTRTVLWEYKWIIQNSIYFNQISLKQFEAFVRDFKRRYIKNGKSLRTLNLYLSRFYLPIDKEKAEECYQKFKRLSRDDRSDCRACERRDEAEYLILSGRFDEGIELCKDIFSGRLTCTEEPYDAYGVVLKKYTEMMIHGDMSVAEKAKEAREGIKPAFRKKLLYYRSAEIIKYEALTGNIKEAMTLFKKYCVEMYKTHVPGEKLDFNIAAAKLFELSANPKHKFKLSDEHPLFNEKGVYNDKDFYDFYLNESVTTAQKLDKRNGTDYYINYIKSLFNI